MPIDAIVGIGIYGSLILLIAVAFKRGPGLSLPTLVLQEWKEQPGPGGDLVVVRGRRAGLVAFLLELVGIDPRVRLILRANEIELSSTGLLGHSYQRIPISRVAATSAGFSRPLHWLLLGGLVVAYGAFADARLGFWKLVVIVIGLALLGAFVLGKAAYVSVQAFAGLPLGIRFKGSLLHAQAVDLGAAQRFTRLVGDLTLGAAPVAAVPETQTRVDGHEETAPKEPPPPVTAYCDYCGRRGVVGQPCLTCQRTVE